MIHNIDVDLCPCGEREKKALRYEKKKSDDDNSMETGNLKFRFESVIDSMALAKLSKYLLCHSSSEYKIGMYHSCLKWAMNYVFAKWFLPMQDRKWYFGLFIHLHKGSHSFFLSEMLSNRNLDCQLPSHAWGSVDAKCINHTPMQGPCLHMGTPLRGGKDVIRQQVFRIKKPCWVRFVISRMMQCIHELQNTCVFARMFR